MKTITTSIEPIDYTTNNPLIPKVIYQTWKSNQLTDYLNGGNFLQNIYTFGVNNNVILYSIGLVVISILI